MDALIYKKIFDSEESHFYYRSNREFLSFLIKKYCKVNIGYLNILDVGCGTGFTAKYLERFGEVQGIDISDLALKYARARGVKVAYASVDKLPFSENTFDLVICFDVIYHRGVKKDERALSEIYRVLKPLGICILRVPAKIVTESSYDKLVHTKHRYIKSELSQKLSKTGYNILKLSFVDIYLVPLILTNNLVEKIYTLKARSHVYRPPGLINFLLTLISSIEKRLVGRINLPFGAGLISVVSKPAKKFRQ